jgi:uncharacterized membrane protein YkvA (DUF1232 family)
VIAIHGSQIEYNGVTLKKESQMADKKPTDITVSPQGGMIRNFINRTKLIWRLMTDPRVSPWVKLIPIGSLVYLISPIDLLMGIPGVDAVDDVTVLWLGSTLFVELCPPAVVEEHIKALAGEAKATDTPGEVVDAETTDLGDKKLE